MAFRIKVEEHINIPKNMAKVRDNKFWEFGANEWWRLITPYTPMETGTTSESVDIKPKEIIYLHPDAHFLHKGELMIDPDTGSSWARKGVKKVYAGTPLEISKAKHPLATKDWDKAAEPTQKPKLIRAMQGYIDSGGLNL